MFIAASKTINRQSDWQSVWCDLKCLSIRYEDIYHTHKNSDELEAISSIQWKTMQPILNAVEINLLTKKDDHNILFIGK